MSQDPSTNENSAETRKRVLLGVLGAVLLGVVYYQFFSGASDRPSARPTGAGPAIAKASPTPRPAARPGATPEPIVSQPLDLVSMTSKASGEGTGRNIFVYPPPPPPPTPKPQPTAPPPPPPPVTLYSANPAGVIARTGDFTLTVFGEKLQQPDLVGYVDGRELPTTVIGPGEVKIKVPAEAIRNPANLGIQVRSKSDPKIYSNQVSLNVAAPPEPPYKFIGLIVTRDGPMAVLKSQSSEEEVVNVRKGSYIDKAKHWRVLSITPQRIEIEDTGIKISHTINYTGENS